MAYFRILVVILIASCNSGSNSKNSCLKAIGSKKQLSNSIDQSEQLGLVFFNSSKDSSKSYSCTAIFQNLELINDYYEIDFLTAKHCFYFDGTTSITNESINDVQDFSFRFLQSDSSYGPKFKIGKPWFQERLENLDTFDSKIQRNILKSYGLSSDISVDDCKLLRHKILGEKKDRTQSSCFSASDLSLVKFKVKKTNSNEKMMKFLETKVSFTNKEEFQFHQKVELLRSTANTLAALNFLKETLKHSSIDKRKVLNTLNTKTTIQGKFLEKFDEIKSEEIYGLWKEALTELGELESKHWEKYINKALPLQFMTNLRYHGQEFDLMLPRIINTGLNPINDSINKTLGLEVHIDHESRSVLFIHKADSNSNSYSIVFEPGDSGSTLSVDGKHLAILSTVNGEPVRRATHVSNGKVTVTPEVEDKDLPSSNTSVASNSGSTNNKTNVSSTVDTNSPEFQANYAQAKQELAEAVKNTTSGVVAMKAEFVEALVIGNENPSSTSASRDKDEDRTQNDDVQENSDRTENPYVVEKQRASGNQRYNPYDTSKIATDDRGNEVCAAH